MTDIKAATAVVCGRCERPFVPRLKFQVAQTPQGTSYYCSQVCRQPVLGGAAVKCVTCKKDFIPKLASQLGANPFCSTTCKPQMIEQKPDRPARILAVLNQKGGTGKTTTAVTVAAGLARAGLRTLLIDLDAQGSIGASLGLPSKRAIHHLLLGRAPLHTCVQNVGEHFDVITADEGLAAAEIELARIPTGKRTRRLETCLAGATGYDYIILDCAPALSLLNHNALVYAGEVLIPVSCDYLSLIGVKQVLRTIRRVSEQEHTTVRIAGVLPTFFDTRNKVCSEVLGYLRKTFGARALPPVRVNTRIAEAPSCKRTIFDHAPDSNGARDYIRVIEWLRTGYDAEASRAA